MQCKQHFNYRLWYFVIVWNENFVLVFINFIIRFIGLAARAYKLRNVVKFHPTQTRTVGNGSFFSRIIEPTYYRQEHAIAWWPTVPPRNKYYFSIWWWLIMSLLRWEIICLASHNHSFVKWHIIFFYLLCVHNRARASARFNTFTLKFYEKQIKCVMELNVSIHSEMILVFAEPKS